MKTMILKILILGGTNFLGPHLVEEMQSRGHEITLFNRGTQNPSFFPDVEQLHGNRENDLSALEGRKWDAIIDTCGYIPRIVEVSSRVLKDATKHYTFISSISAYENFHHIGIDETYPLAQLDVPDKEEITEKTYGALKAGCEQVIQSYFSDRALIVRPGLIVGPYDHTDRFTYWPVRIKEGGIVLAPGNPRQNVQFIDVRDLACWIIDMIEKQATGIFNATGQKMTFETFLAECQEVSKTAVNVEWVSEDFLLEHKVQDWTELPLWVSKERNMPGFLSINIDKAVSAGLKFRPLSETIAATLDWNAQRKNDGLKAGIDRQKEQELLKLNMKLKL